MLLRLARHLLLVLAVLAIVPVAASAACGDTIIDDYLDDGRVDGEYTQACYDNALGNLDDDLREYTNAEQDIRTAKQRARNNARPPVTAQTEPETQLPPPPAQPGDDDDSGGGGASPSPSPSEGDGSSDSTPGASDGGGGGDRSGSGGGGSAGGGDGDDLAPAEDGEPAIGSEDEGAPEDGIVAAEERLDGTGGVLGVETEVAQSADTTSNGPLQQALRDVGPTGGDDLPVPVLVLGGLAVLLIAVGAGGIVLRRLQSR